jgi:hypothetical protein
MIQISTRTNYLISILLLMLFSTIWSVSLLAQTNPDEQLVQKKQAQEEKAIPQLLNLFTAEVMNEKSYPQGDDLPPGLVLKYDRKFAIEALKSNHRTIEMELPNPNGGENLILLLERKSIFTPDFQVYLDIENKITLDYTPGLHYAGVVKGMKGTQVGISIFDDEIMGVIATQTTNLVIQKLKGSVDDHFFFDERFADKDQMLLCATPDSGEPYKFGPINNIEQKLFGNCIRVFVEIGNSTVQDRGGMIQAINFITGVFHQSTLIFNAESINSVLSQILVRTPANDPYDPLADKSTSNIRTTFQSVTTTMDADLGQVVVTFGTGTGGIAAGVWNALIRPDINDRLCVTSKAVGQNFSVYPTYSRMVKVFNHEMGHLLASRHTHACVWNGNGTQIDDYGNADPITGAVPGAEGEACVDENNLILNVTPTIMSYFDSWGHGTFPMSNGYGTQPGNVIRAAVATALIANEIETDCSAPLNDLCADAWTLQCGTTLYGNIDDATSSDGPGPCLGGGNGTDPGVWFTFTGNGQVFTVSTAGSSFDTQVSIFSGTCGNLTCIGGDDDSGPGLTSSFTFCTVNGTQYYVYLDGFGGSTGNYTINLTCVNDIIPPDVSCPGNVNQFNDPGDCGAIVNYPPATATDNCGVQSITYSQNSGTFFPVGNTTVTVTATDINSNTATCTFSVTVADNEPPTIMCSDGSIVFNGEDQHILDPDDYTVYDDNCGIQSVELDPPFITCDDLGDILLITATATDIYGNTEDCTFNLEVLGLPCGWSFTPDGINCTDGNDVSYSVPLDEFYVESTNCYFAHPFSSDVMGFAQYELCGDGSITAHVTDISGNALGWAGVSMRENNNGGAKKVQLMTNRSNLSRREVRSVTNGSSTPQQFLSFNRYWLRLTRSGNQFSGYVSNNGMNWFYVMAATVQMPECIQIGLVVTNYNSSSTVTATFANVVVDENMMMMPVDDNPPLTFSENRGADQLQVYPNPSDGILYIDYTRVEAGMVELQVIDPLGRTVKYDTWTQANTSLQTMQLHNLPTGVYYLRFTGDGGFNETRRIVLSTQN